MKKSLRRKYIVMISMMVVIAIVIGLCLSIAFSNRFYVNIKQRSLQAVYNRVNELYSGGSEERDTYENLLHLCEENAIALLVIKPSGGTAFTFGNYDSLYSRLNDLMLSRENSQFTRIIEKNKSYVLQTYTESNNIGYIELWGYLDNGFFIIARSSYAGISNSVGISLMFFGIVCIIVFLIVATFGSIVIKPYTDSISRMVAFARKANMGEFEAEYEEKRHKSYDEIGTLGENINEMSKKLEKTISELKTTNLRLENELKAKIAQEEARKKYMSDVSHELKTPIALISGYAEGIKEGISDSPEDREYYCNVIIDEAEKMNLMLKKLATLNQLEFGKNEVSLERFDLTQVVDGFLNTMAIVIEEKGANVFFDNSNPVYVWSDEFLVEEALMNYFNNALNHLDSRKTVRIHINYVAETTVRLTVYNSGTGIPEDELDKIWGQFYKVDKARTREYGGSGLGLSIVKAIADSLGQECGVVNEEGGVAGWLELEGCERHPDEEKKKCRRLTMTGQNR